MNEDLELDKELEDFCKDCEEDKTEEKPQENKTEEKSKEEDKTEEQPQEEKKASDVPTVQLKLKGMNDKTLKRIRKYLMAELDSVDDKDKLIRVTLIQKIDNVLNERTNQRLKKGVDASKIVKELGTLTLVGVLGVLGYRADRSDELFRNKESKGLASRLLQKFI